MDDALSAVLILEKDVHQDVLLSWYVLGEIEDIDQGRSAPSLEPTELGPIAISRSGLKLATIPAQFTFSRYSGKWIYIYTEANKNTAPALKSVIAFSMCLFTTEFQPEKYGTLCKALAATYQQSGSPIDVYDVYLKALRGSEVVGYDAEAFDNAEGGYQALLATSIKDICKLFEQDVIHIWTALMTKKRVIVYSERVSTLLKIVRGLPLFVWHRQDWGQLRPYVTNTEEEIDELKRSAIYVAGFTDPSIKRRTDLYDVLVDISGREVIVSEPVQDGFALTSLHKDVGSFLMKAMENDEVEDKPVIMELSKKSKNIVAKLEALREVNEETGQPELITFETLQQQGLSPGLDRFLFAVASAEGMAALH